MDAIAAFAANVRKSAFSQFVQPAASGGLGSFRTLAAACLKVGIAGPSRHWATLVRRLLFLGFSSSR